MTRSAVSRWRAPPTEWPNAISTGPPSARSNGRCCSQVAQALLPAASALMPTPAGYVTTATTCRAESRHCRQECLRHAGCINRPLPGRPCARQRHDGQPEILNAGNHLEEFDHVDGLGDVTVGVQVVRTEDVGVEAAGC